MDLMQLRAMAKINLGLDVVRKREDGYHEVRMIMQTIRMFDRVTVYRIPEPEIRISSNLHFLPVNENNIAYKAARMMLESQPVRGGVSISLQKRIPVAAGMAGGSADAAAVLYAMNRIFYMGYTLEELMDFGLRLGADVPYCLMRGTALAEGIEKNLQDCRHVRRATLSLQSRQFPFPHDLSMKICVLMRQQDILIFMV